MTSKPRWLTAHLLLLRIQNNGTGRHISHSHWAGIHEAPQHDEGERVPAALEGLQIIDFTSGLPGAITTMILCDNGADVIKIESPGGDADREQPAFVQWHRGKQSVIVDLATSEGIGRARALAVTADVLVQSWRPGVADRLGLGYDDLAALNPRLVYCSITGFGPKGPYANAKGYDAIVAAKSGVMSYAETDRPRFAAIPGGSYGAAQGALQGILSALYVVGNGGPGQKVETSLVQGLTGYAGVLLPGLEQQRMAGSTFTPISGMVGFTSDGRWLQFANFRPHLVAAFLEATGLTRDYDAAMGRGDSPDAVRELVLRRLHEKTLDEWMEILLASDDIGIEPFRTPLEALDHPQMLHNRHVIDVVDPQIGKTRQLGPLVDLAQTPALESNQTTVDQEDILEVGIGRVPQPFERKMKICLGFVKLEFSRCV